MEKQQAYLKIDELFSQYIDTEESFRRDAIKSKILKIICDIVNSDSDYKPHIENGDFDYLPILTATNDALKYFKQKEEGCFHSYLLSCIKNAVNKDLEKNSGKGFALNYSNIKELKKVKKLLQLYKGNKQKVVAVLDISEEKMDALLLSEKIDYFSKQITGSDSESTIEDYLPASKYESIESKIDAEDDLNRLLTAFDLAWKDLKEIHQDIVSDWLTNITLSALETSKNIKFMEDQGEAIKFLFKYSYIKREIVQAYFASKEFELSLTYESIGNKYGITKAAVYKKIQNFVEELKKYKII